MIRSRAKVTALAVALGAIIPVANAQTGGKTVQQLEQELSARDAVINDLQRRVQALEQKVGDPPKPVSAPPPATATKAPPPDAPKAALKPPKEEPIDEDLLARALERSLVLTGGALLPRGSFEIEPGLRYDYNARTFLGLTRRENYVASVGFKAGLPWAAQFELSIPFGYQKVVTTIPTFESETGIGDVSVGLSKQFLYDRPGSLGLLANVTYTHSTGDSNLGIPLPGLPSLGSGYNSWQVGLTALKRVDPLVFVGSVSYAFNRTADVMGNSFDPNDTGAASFRAILATSPSVSLRGGFSLARTGNTRVNGIAINGTRTNVGLLEFGGSVSLTRSVLLDLSVSAGLTEDAPDYILGISLPIRF